LQFTYPQASIKDAQAPGEAFSPQKGTSSTSKDEHSDLFSIFLESLFPSWILIRIRNLYADPDPDPTAQINADPCGYESGSGSETLAGSTVVTLKGSPDPRPLLILQTMRQKLNCAVCKYSPAQKIRF
jgi:hypothetical protein